MTKKLLCLTVVLTAEDGLFNGGKSVMGLVQQPRWHRVNNDDEIYLVNNIDHGQFATAVHAMSTLTKFCL